MFKIQSTSNMIDTMHWRCQATPIDGVPNTRHHEYDASLSWWKIKRGPFRGSEHPCSPLRHRGSKKNSAAQNHIFEVLKHYQIIGKCQSPCSDNRRLSLIQEPWTVVKHARIINHYHKSWSPWIEIITCHHHSPVTIDLIDRNQWIRVTSCHQSGS